MSASQYSFGSFFVRVFVTAFVLVTPSWAEEIVPRTAVFVLVDISGTWLSKTNETQNDKVIRETNRAVLDLLGKVETPAAIFLITIEADSVLGKPICEAVYSRKLLALGKKGNVFVQREKLANYLELCGMALLKRQVAKWTDIHGALDMISRLASAGSYTQLYLFVLSDFKEERPVGPMPSIALNNFRVASIYRILPEDSQNPKGLDARLEKWRSVLTKAGAARTIEAVDKGRFAGSVVQRLLNND